MPQILISRDLYSEAPHLARKAADQQASLWDHAEILGLSRDYYPTVELQAADLYLVGTDAQIEKMIEEISRGYDPGDPETLLSIEIIVPTQSAFDYFEALDHAIDISTEQ